MQTTIVSCPTVVIRLIKRTTATIINLLSASPALCPVVCVLLSSIMVG